MTLYQLALETARRITMMREGRATAVNVAYIDDSNKAFGVDEYNNGTIFLTDTTPKWLAITDTTATRISFAAQAGAPSASCPYAIANADYPIDVITGAISQAIKDLHAQTAEDATLDTDSDVQEYTLPTGVRDLLKVEIETPLYIGTTETSYLESHHWHEAGSKLRFTPGFEPLTDGYAIRLTYRARPADVSLAADVIPDGLDYELLIWKAVVNVLRWGMQRYGQDPNRRVIDRLNEAQQELARRGANKRTYQKSTIFGGW